MKSELKKNAVLMRLAIGCPGTERSDRKTSDEIKELKHLGSNSGRWVKEKYPPEALRDIRKLDGEAQRYHAAVTLPFDSGIGILPAGLILEYSQKMREFASRRSARIQQFREHYEEYIEWAKSEHNGTFDPADYPPIDEVAARFSFDVTPLPVPDSCHFEAAVNSLLGTDAEAIDRRVADAETRARSELLKRMIEPVARMARTLAKDEPRIFDTLTANIAAVAKLVPALNLSSDPQLDAFASEMMVLTRYSREELKEQSGKTAARLQAEAVLEKLKGYAL